MEKKRPTGGDRKAHWILFLILALALAARLYILCLPQPKAPGDAYNSIKNAEYMTRLDYYDPKRLPVYSLVLIPPTLLFETEIVVWAERLISAVSSLGVLVLLYMIGRELGIQDKIIYLSIFFLALQPFFLENSVIPYDKSFFAFMVYLSMYLSYKSDTRNKKILFGVVLGLTCMTRYEGFVLAFSLFLGMAAREGIKTKTVSALKIPLLLFILVVIPWFVKNAIVYGNPLYTGYLESSRYDIGDVPLPIAYLHTMGIYSLDDVIQHANNFVYVLLSSWSVIPRDFGEKLDWLVLSAVLSLFFTAAGFIAFILKTRKTGLPVTLFTISYSLLLIWAVERGKYTIPLIPLISLYMILGVFTASRIMPKKLSPLFSALVITLILYTTIQGDMDRIGNYVLTAERQKNMGVPAPKDSLELLRQDKSEDWDGTYIDFFVGEDMVLQKMSFDVVFVRGSDYEMSFDWFVGEDGGPFNLTNPVLVLGGYTPRWELGRQTIEFDSPVDVKGGVKYTLYVKTLKKNSVSENALYIKTKDPPDDGIYYGVRRNNPEWANAQGRLADLTLN